MAEPPKRVQLAGQRVARAEANLNAERQRLRDEMAAARDAVESLAAIDRALGITRQRVSEILDKSSYASTLSTQNDASSRTHSLAAVGFAYGVAYGLASTDDYRPLPNSP